MSIVWKLYFTDELCVITSHATFALHFIAVLFKVSKARILSRPGWSRVIPNETVTPIALDLQLPHYMSD
jgi:hypothetical protein